MSIKHKKTGPLPIPQVEHEWQKLALSSRSVDSTRAIFELRRTQKLSLAEAKEKIHKYVNQYKR